MSDGRRKKENRGGMRERVEGGTKRPNGNKSDIQARYLGTDVSFPGA
jgi:hypothetical protein